MKAIQFFQTFSAILLLSSTTVQAQNHLEVGGKAKITVMDKDNTADSVVVRQADGALAVRDISTLSEFPVIPVLAGTLGIGNGPTSVYVSGRYAYVVYGGSNDLKVIDISNPGAPALTGSIGIGTFPISVYVSGRYAYVVDQGSNDLKVIDISNPGAPTVVGSLGIGDGPTSIYVSGRYAYVVDQGSDDLKIIDISNPGAPALAGSLGIGGVPRSVYVSGRYAYVVDWISDDLKVIDVSNPNAPVVTGSLGLGQSPGSVYVSGRYAYVVDEISDDLKVIDVSGGEYTSIIAHSLEAGNLQVRNDVIAQGQLQVTGGINVGSGGVFSDGNLAVNGSIQSKDLTVKDDNNIATFQASGNNSFIKLETNGGTAGTTVGYYDDSSDKYFFVDTPEGGFGELVILADGKVGMGELSPTHPLQMASGAHCTAAGVWTDASDISKKYNIIPLEYGLKEMLQLRPMSYNYKIDDSNSIGFIAQEVEKVIPEIVSGEEESKGIGYGQLNAVLVNAIKEQQSMIADQQIELKLHQHLLDTQNAQIDKLKKQVFEFDQLRQEMAELRTLVKAQLLPSSLEE